VKHFLFPNQTDIEVKHGRVLYQMLLAGRLPKFLQIESLHELIANWTMNWTWVAK